MRDLRPALRAHRARFATDALAPVRRPLALRNRRARRLPGERDDALEIWRVAIGRVYDEPRRAVVDLDDRVPARPLVEHGLVNVAPVSAERGALSEARPRLRRATDDHDRGCESRQPPKRLL